MDEILPVIVRGMILVSLFGTLMFGLHSCFAEDHRHSEEMRRLQLIEQGCVEESP